MNINPNKVIKKLQERLAELHLQNAVLQVQIEDLSAQLNKKDEDNMIPEQLELDIEDE